MSGTQKSVVRCEVCGERCAVSQLSAYEFTYACSRHGGRVISWAHAAPAPQFERERSLFDSEGEEEPLDVSRQGVVEG